MSGLSSSPLCTSFLMLCHALLSPLAHLGNPNQTKFVFTAYWDVVFKI